MADLIDYTDIEAFLNKIGVHKRRLVHPAFTQEFYHRAGTDCVYHRKHSAGTIIEEGIVTFENSTQAVHFFISKGGEVW